jgi:anti-sigma factor RsiW
MKTDDILLMAYVDGELPPEERLEVEQQIAASAEVAERVALFEASRLPYGDAFAKQKLPPVPESLTKAIENLARQHAANPNANSDKSANDPVLEHNAQLPPSAPVRSRLRIAPMWLAVAFVAGVFCCGAVLRFTPGPNPAANTTVASANVSPWVKAVVGYQAMYGRETLANATIDADGLKQIASVVRSDDGIALNVPDLSDAGLTLRRVQRLNFNNRRVIQIEYLPENGPPIALCIIKDAKPDQTVASQRMSDMNVVTWRQANLGYVLLAKGSDVDLTALGKRIAAGHEVGELVGQVDVLGLNALG